MKILNLGCGYAPIKGAINIDIHAGKYVDQIVDLRKLPWPWKSGTIDGIYMIHSLEHFRDRVAILKECWRVLKEGGFLHIETPHASGIYALTPLEHYTAFNTLTFNQMPVDLCLEGRHFRKDYMKIFWLCKKHDHNHPYVSFVIDNSFVSYPGLRRWFKPISWIIQHLIDASPILFERIWCAWVGGADEIVWQGKKIRSSRYSGCYT